MTSLVAQMVKHLPIMWETWVQSLGGKDLLEKEMATHSSILAWRIPWTEEPVGDSPWGRKELATTEWLRLTSPTLVKIILYIKRDLRSVRECQHIALLLLLSCFCHVQLCATNPMGCSSPDSSVHGDSPGKNTGVGCHALFRGMFLTQGSNLGLLNCRQILYHWATREA